MSLTRVGVSLFVDGSSGVERGGFRASVNGESSGSICVFNHTNISVQQVVRRLPSVSSFLARGCGETP